MTGLELPTIFIYLVGTCAMHWCSFNFEIEKDDSYIIVKVQDVPTQTIETMKFSIQDLIMDGYKKEFKSCPEQTQPYLPLQKLQKQTAP